MMKGYRLKRRSEAFRTAKEMTENTVALNMNDSGLMQLVERSDGVFAWLSPAWGTGGVKSKAIYETAEEALNGRRDTDLTVFYPAEEKSTDARSYRDAVADIIHRWTIGERNGN